MTHASRGSGDVPAGPEGSGGPAMSEPIGADFFRQVVGRFATGVTVMTTRAGGIDHAMTASTFTSVSLDPLLVLACVEKEARFHDAVVEAGVFGITVLTEHQRALASWLATRGRPLHGQLNRAPHHHGRLTGVALLEDGLASLEARVMGVHPGGDHSIVVGEVLSASLGDGEPGALLHYRGQFARVD